MPPSPYVRPGASAARLACCVLLLGGASNHADIGSSKLSRSHGSLASGQGPASQPAVVLSVATYNINYGNPNLNVVAAAIARADADLVCLQETNAASERYLRRVLGRRYPHIRFRNDRRWAGGFALLSKRPLRRVWYLPPKHGPFGIYFCELLVGTQTVRVASVHLMPLIPRRGDRATTLWKRLGQTDATRRKELTRLMAVLPKDRPVVVAGDFNAPPYLASAKQMPEAGFVDSYAAAQGGHTAAGATWHWQWQGVDWHFRLDYVFHSRHLRTLRSRVIPAEASDHYLLVSHLAWQAPGRGDRALGAKQTRGTSSPGLAPPASNP